MNELYRKVGRKYVKISADDSLFSYLRDGFYLIHAYEYGRSLTRIEPDNLAVRAAIELVRESMCDAMIEASRPKPGGFAKPITPKERRAYAAYEKIMGKNAPASWIGESVHFIVDAGIKVLEGTTKRLPPF
jgi:hypothetical protein